MTPEPNSSDSPRQHSPPPTPNIHGPWARLWQAEDWWAVWIGGALLTIAAAVAYAARPDGFAARSHRIAELREQIAAVDEQLAAAPTGDADAPAALQAARSEARMGLRRLESDLRIAHPLKRWVDKPAAWRANPIEAVWRSDGMQRWPGILGALVVGLAAFGLGVWAMPSRAPGPFAPAFVAVFALAALASIAAEHVLASHYGLEFALWALVLGLLISNTLGTPRWMRPALRTELYIKTGLVLLGAEVLLSRLIELGVPGIFIAWVVTPIVLVSTYVFGQRVLRVPSKSLNMTLSADMSVCGVSAAIAVGAACKAKKEELSLAIGISLTFTVIMMIVLPAVVKAVGMGQVLAGAWLGGTIDSTGAVAAAGGLVGETALQVATVVKMIQNVLIGVIAFAVALYWVMYEEQAAEGSRPSAMEIWRRFPKFVLGFLGASLAFSAVYAATPGGEQLVQSTTDATKNLRGWFFCLAFVSIGLETNFRELAGFLKGGKPIVLYVCGQALNLTLTLVMAWLMFRVVFPEAAAGMAD
jgi:uncharacterized membrane protein YadS